MTQICTCTNKKNFYNFFFLNARCSASYKIMGVNDLCVINFAQRKNGQASFNSKMRKQNLLSLWHASGFSSAVHTD